jgi:hypothetical protein
MVQELQVGRATALVGGKRHSITETTVVVLAAAIVLLQQQELLKKPHLPVSTALLAVLQVADTVLLHHRTVLRTDIKT